MTRNILPKSDEMKVKETFSLPTPSISTKKSDKLTGNSKLAFKSNGIASVSSSSNLSSDDTEEESIKSLNFQAYQNCFSLKPPFSRVRLNQWHTNEEIYNILTKCCFLYSLNSKNTTISLTDSPQEINSFKLLNEWLTDEVIQRPNNGSVYLFDRRKVKSFKKDGYTWKRRKTGGANSVREDRMYLKINGVECIYGCYSHSSIIPTFHRRCYWLIDKPDLILVHYLQAPNNDTGECFISLNLNTLNFSTNSESNSGTAAQVVGTNSDNQISREDLKSEIKAMLWPYYMNKNFLEDNLKQLSQLNRNFKDIQNFDLDEFLNSILSHLFENTGSSTNQISSIRINLNGYLNQINLNDSLLCLATSSSQPVVIENNDKSNFNDKNNKINESKIDKINENNSKKILDSKSINENDNRSSNRLVTEKTDEKLDDQFKANYHQVYIKTKIVNNKPLVNRKVQLSINCCSCNVSQK